MDLILMRKCWIGVDIVGEIECLKLDRNEMEYTDYFYSLC